MKNLSIIVSLFICILSITLNTLSYKITYHPRNIIPIYVKVYKSKPSLFSIPAAQHKLMFIGSEAAWNQKDIRNKFGQNKKELYFELFQLVGKNPEEFEFVQGALPIDANIEVLVTQDKSGKYIGGAYDMHNKRYLNEEGYRKAEKLLGIE